jgi:hypothetical protein
MILQQKRGSCILVGLNSSLSSSLWVANRPQVTALTTGLCDSFELWRILRATRIAPYRHQALQCYQKCYMLKKDFTSEVESGCRNSLGP